jgi:hypothetical protein
MTGTLDEDTLPPSLRFLKRLVIVLMLTMIAGVITVVALLVIRMPQPAPMPRVPAQLTLPAGIQAAAVTFGQNWVAIVTTTDHILIYGTDGKLWQDIAVQHPVD